MTTDPDIKLIHMRDPEPSTHFDPRMNWKLRDVALPPSDKEKTVRFVHEKMKE